MSVAAQLYYVRREQRRQCNPSSPRHRTRLSGARGRVNQRSPEGLYPSVRILLLTTLALLAFAANSVLCKVALTATAIDPASFTSLRVASGALTLALIVAFRSRGRGLLEHGSWLSALALATYAAAFSFAYEQLTTATGALLLFASVQVTMVGRGLWNGERLGRGQILGFVLALAGLLGLLLPGVAAPSPAPGLLMVGAGIAWGVYSLRGRGATDATAATAGNFLRAVPIAAAVSLLALSQASVDGTGIGLAVASGAVASGLGYVIWYSVLPSLRASTAASVQLAVPPLAAAGGIALLGEPLTLHLLLASTAILGGIALVIGRRR